MGKSVHFEGASVECRVSDLCSIWRELTGEFSPLTLTGEEFPRVVRLAVEGGGVELVEGAGDLLGRVELRAVELIGAGRVPRSAWRVLLRPLGELRAKLPDGAGDGMLVAGLRGEVELDALPLEVALIVASGSVRASELLEVALLARGLVFA